MAVAGYRFDLGETWLLNESTARRGGTSRRTPAPRCAISSGASTTAAARAQPAGHRRDRDRLHAPEHPRRRCVQGGDEELARGQRVLEGRRRKIRILTKETYPDARFWGVAGSSRHERSEHLTEYMEHLNNLVESGPEVAVGSADVHAPHVHAAWQRNVAGIGSGSVHAAVLLRARLDTDPARGDAQLRLRAGVRGAALRREPPTRRASRSPRVLLAADEQLQPPACRMAGRKTAIAARIASAIHYAYRQGGASAEGACSPPESGEDWCRGGDVGERPSTRGWGRIVRVLGLRQG